MKKYPGIFLIVAVGILCVILIFWLSIGDEDLWICEHGNWIKHGQPTSDKPNWDCSLTSSYTSTTDSEVIVSSPSFDEIIKSPFIVKGKAVGNWFFEGSFPVKLVDENMNIITSSFALALTDWMTTDYVDFTATMTFKVSTSTKGFLILKNDNPSGLLKKDKSIKLPVIIN